MQRFVRLYHNARRVELFGLGATALIFLLWGADLAVKGQWSHPLVWTPLFFVLARALVFMADARSINRGKLLAYVLMVVAASVATLSALVLHDDWLFNLGLGAGVWLAIGEWFWRISDPRYVPVAEPRAQASA